MSEYQYVAFRAIDQQVGASNLEFMRKQSSRADITPWSFENEYHFGEFAGNVNEMMRRGYDIHLHYANYGIRKLLIRLPHGLPGGKESKPYITVDTLRYIPDKQGTGGILCIQPYVEPGDQEDLWELEDLLNRLVAIRAEILNGDLRPLYLAHLAVASDDEHAPDETHEAPVPAGLGKLTNAQSALAEFFGIKAPLISAAAQDAPPLEARGDQRDQQAEWIRIQPQSVKDAWLSELMGDPQSTVVGRIRSEFQKSQKTPTWPTVHSGRTIAELQAIATEIEQKTIQRSIEKAACEKAKRLAAMAENPSQTLRETEDLVKNRSTTHYAKAAQLLAELRESLAGTDQAGLAEQQAQKLRLNNPTLKTLVSILRREGFLPK